MTAAETCEKYNEPKTRSARSSVNPRNKHMWTETNRFPTDDRARRTKREDLKHETQVERCALPECLSRHWLASAVAAWKRTCGHGYGLRQRDLRRQHDLCFALGCRALLRTGSGYL